VLQAALAKPPLFDYCLRRAEAREHVARILTGVFGDYLPAEAALRPALVAELVWP
jgi:hypothetical protein